MRLAIAGNNAAKSVRAASRWIAWPWTATAFREAYKFGSSVLSLGFVSKFCRDILTDLLPDSPGLLAKHSYFLAGLLRAFEMPEALARRVFSCGERFHSLANTIWRGGPFGIEWRITAGHGRAHVMTTLLRGSVIRTEQRGQRFYPRPRRKRLRGGEIISLIFGVALLVGVAAIQSWAAFVRPAALYPIDSRRLMLEHDYRHYPGAGVLMCRTEGGAIERSAAAWLIGSRRLVVLNAHNFIDR
ncbi:MAG TPA: hypothetical protein VFG05_02915, partial [Methylocella sp.]|nr:hypothetical protein [Methylocella sp.]